MPVEIHVRLEGAAHLMGMACLGVVAIQATLAKRANDRLADEALPEVTILFYASHVLMAACIAWAAAALGDSILAALAQGARLAMRRAPRGAATEFVETDDWEAGECWVCYNVRPLVRCMPCGDRSCCHACVTGWLGSNPTFACLTCRKVPAVLRLPAIPQPGEDS